MFAIIRAGVNGQTYNMFSDGEFFDLMNTGTEFSLGHFWDAGTFGAADMRYELLGPVFINDPRPGSTDARRDLQQAVIEAVGPRDWRRYSHVIFMFGHPEDFFGGGWETFMVPGIGPGGTLGPISLPTCVVNTTIAFDFVCHEVGHALLGIWHAYDSNTVNYGDPYDIMSAQTYGNTFPGFDRGPVTGLPDGFPAATAPYRNVGPLPSPTRLLSGAYSNALRPRHIVHAPEDLRRPFTCTLTAWGDAVRTRSVTPVVVVIPPQVPNGDTYMLTLRTPHGYDRGCEIDGNPPAALVIHKRYASSYMNDRVGHQPVFLASLPLTRDGRGDRDYHSFAGFFTVRVDEQADDLSWVRLTIGGADAWRHFVTTVQQAPQWEYRVPGPWTPFTIDATGIPGRDCMAGSYTYQLVAIHQQIECTASSVGYEKPFCAWSINGQTLAPGFVSSSFTFTVDVVEPGPKGPRSSRRPVTVFVTKNEFRLTITSREAVNFELTVAALMGEGSNEVMKNLYPDTRDEVVCSIVGGEINYDREYDRRHELCHPRIPRIDLIPIPIPWIDKGDPPPWIVRPDLITRALWLEQAIHTALLRQDTALAEELLDYGVRILQVPREQFLVRLPQSPAKRDEPPCETA